MQNFAATTNSDKYCPHHLYNRLNTIDPVRSSSKAMNEFQSTSPKTRPDTKSETKSDSTRRAKRKERRRKGIEEAVEKSGSVKVKE